jgi:FkbM family methyltransferase
VIEYTRELIASILKKHGINVAFSQKSNYEYLLDKPRYNEYIVSLLGNEFVIADSLSFYYSHREIFIDEIYKFNSKHDDPVILDCGSNYGTSILYFKSIYPDAIITGVEADPDIYKVLSKNIDRRLFSNVKLINKALTNNKGPMIFFSEGADGGRIHVNADATNIFEIETIPLDDLIEGQVDYLKLDIEGAETDVILSSKKLSQIGQMFIEYHSFIEEKQKLGDLLTCLSENKFRYYIQTQFCSKKPLIDSKTQLGMDLQLNIFAKQK